MARSLAPDKERATLAILAAVVVLSWETAGAQVAVIAAAGVIGWRLFRGVPSTGAIKVASPVGRNVAVGAWVLFIGLLAGLPLVAAAADSHAVDLVDAFYRTGSLVFGGGHVVLPLLEETVVAPGWISRDEFLAGYGAAQAVPGPMFTISAYLGARLPGGEGGAVGAAVALIAIFLPGFLLVAGALPLWRAIAGRPAAAHAIAGVNAAVVGLLGAALYDPVWTSAVRGPLDLAIALVGFTLLAAWKASALLVVLWCVCASAAAALMA
jgi:chromate transporter